MQRVLGRERRVVSGARAIRELYDLYDNGAFHLREAPLFDGMQIGRRNERQDVECQGFLDVVQTGGARAAQREARIGQPARLHQIRFRHPKFLK